MRSLFVVLLAVLTFTVNSQSILFHENFELPSLDDSVVYTSTSGSFTWNINTRVHHGVNSLRCDSCQVKAGTTVYMKTVPFSTIGSSVITLNFSQICKVDFLDIATIEVSPNGGATWTQLTGDQYTGTGQYAGNGNRFASNSYGNLWVPGTMSQLPSNTWWRSESFDLTTLLTNTSQAVVRFKLADGGTVGPNNNKGWYIDNISITGSGMYPFSGTVRYDNNIMTTLSLADVTLVNSNTTVSTATTNLLGYYYFNSCPTGFNQLFVSTNKPWGGVNSADALLVLKHFTGTTPLTGLKLLSADVNGDHIVNSSDALMIMKRFVGLINSFPVGDWVFEPTGFNIPQALPLVINIKGLCYGDVDGSYIPPAP